MVQNLFAVPIFFIVFRETLETSIVVSVLLAFLKQHLGPDRDVTVYKKLKKQVWLGTIVALAICIVIGSGMIGAFYSLGADHWSTLEAVWEGAFSLVASIIISIMGAALLRVSKLQDKWRVKLAKALDAKDSTRTGSRWGRFKTWCEKYAMFMLPFVTVLREGVEAVVFIGGISLGEPAASIPLAAVCGLAAGCLIGYCIYRGGNAAPLQIFLIISTCFLYLVAAALFSRSIWYFENHAFSQRTGGGLSETGSGPGSYDIRNSVWHVNCCNPTVNGGGGWGIFSAILGWQNSATYGSVIGYNVYWLVIGIGFVSLRIKEKRGAWPLMKVTRTEEVVGNDKGSRTQSDGDIASIKQAVEATRSGVDVRGVNAV